MNPKMFYSSLNPVAAAALIAVLPQRSNAVNVDTELLLLVDVSGSVDSSEYNLMMQGYADAFRSANIVSSIASGHHGTIAVALAFWSGANQQSIGVNWTEISDTASANAFATAIESTTRPFSGMTAVGSALSYGAGIFGDETTGTDNGFQSLVQVIDISGDGEDNNTPPDNGNRAENVRNARDQAIADGVDMINALPIGNAGGDLNGYFENNVIAGSAGGTAAFIQPTSTFSDVETSLSLKLANEISAAGAESVAIASVPEPSSSLLLVLASPLLLHRKR